MSKLQIITNNVPRPILSSYELTDKELEDFDYMEDTSEGSFFKYRGQVYSLDNFMSSLPEELSDWHGIHGETFFSGVLIKLSDCGDAVIVGTYYS
tara:strand:+ start:473 stop:757 length:285 start_codon:yes stop_codon:yes gene_type:complete